ncbi:mediator complex, subunit Med18 [Chaetomidium leptoderma]|uniref:Mediator of RNA polymerase II transcription subunit 18 n=1 Tax=Chaetomidium leptoderma TaxID=669021 RepID=A0AAN6ZZB4_9PEZI|nr:mediator complex, subunit Med18 [Chaetomidium leptoderma]
MTYEIFLTDSVEDAKVATARAILSGFTQINEQHRFTRIQHHEPRDSAVKGFSTIKQLQKERRPTTPQWQELHQILVKQPSFLELRTDITEEVEAQNAMSVAGGGEAPFINIPIGKPCALRWTDLPDPPIPQLPYITQRKLVEIADPRAETTLADNKFRAKSDLIEESYHWWLDGIEYVLTRMFVITLDPDPAAPRQIPNLAVLEPVSPHWILYVRASVDSLPAATIPQRMTEGQGHLERVRKELVNVFNFMIFDRRCRDPRIHEPRAA